MNKLIVFWRLNKMSAAVAQKGKLQPKEYKKTPMKTEFPIHITPEEAIEQLEKEHGARPDPPVHTAHQFAEIIGWKEINS